MMMKLHDIVRDLSCRSAITLLFVCSDNITYNNMVGGTSINGGTRGTNTLEANAYEVPADSSAQPRPVQNRRKNESLEATYALPDTYYEYATLGPNEAKVFQCSLKHLHA